MLHIISGTNRPNSRSLQVAKIAQSYFKKHTDDVEIFDLRDFPLKELDGSQYGQDFSGPAKACLDKVNHSDGLIVVCPEYNGSAPGALKYFIDHMKFPEAFEFRPVCFIGLGGRFGGLRPIEHLQQVFGYRDAFIYPQRVFLINIFGTLKDGELHDPTALEVLEKQAEGFCRFVNTLKDSGLHANSRV